MWTKQVDQKCGDDFLKMKRTGWSNALKRYRELLNDFEAHASGDAVGQRRDDTLKKRYALIEAVVQAAATIA